MISFAATARPALVGASQSDGCEPVSVLRKDRTDLGEDAISTLLTQFDEMWNALIPAEQARVVKLLVARVTASDAGLTVDLRHEGLGAIAAHMAPSKPEVA